LLPAFGATGIRRDRHSARPAFGATGIRRDRHSARPAFGATTGRGFVMGGRSPN